ncbi:hypothetical protein [Methylobacterium sp.]|uniref:hypothetical protein n=1 Tax=Methylobacterium sp. TaxID=409 RepID=UPI0025E7C737|nr:hypothetical protein [Methylobacterium sp.]MBY0259619.1 hypothetical protein [Methylobacterium sp.]
MSVTDWSTTPAANATADPTIRAQDGASARALPELVRGVMAKTAALALDQGGALVTSGTGNAYVVTTNSGVTKIAPGVSLSFWADRDNTGEPTLNVDGAGPQRWLGADGLFLPPGSIQEGLLYTVAFAGAVPGSLPAWRMVGGGGAGLSAAGIAFDFSGTLAERAQYDAQPKGKTFLAIADTPLGPSWVLYLKRSSAFADWSTGLPIKASPAQSTADAQAAADAAAAERANAEAQVALAQSQARAADAARTLAEQQAGVSAQQAGVAATQAGRASASAVEAAYLASLVGALSYDMGSLDQPSDGSANFDFGAL